MFIRGCPWSPEDVSCLRGLWTRVPCLTRYLGIRWNNQPAFGVLEAVLSLGAFADGHAIVRAVEEGIDGSRDEFFGIRVTDFFYKLPGAAQSEAVLKCGINVIHPLFGNGTNDVFDPVFDRHRSDLTAHRDGVLLKVAFVGRHKHFERIQLVIKRRRERNDDRCRCVFVPDVILDDETRTGPPLF